MGAFRRVTEQAMDADQLWKAEKYFRFVEWISKKAAPAAQNAIEISALEDLALGDFTEARFPAQSLREAGRGE
jgi:hypothetical protein